ncbi:MAG: prepilin peptidase [bacterium]|nr:prepilin peptidase [bacterium]
MLYFYIFIFLFGLAIGSFINCLVHRMEKEESSLFKGSYCPKCRHKLAWFDLIPLLSFVLLKGKCRYCQKEISFQYPIVELVAGILFVLVFFNFGYSLLSVFYFFLIFSLLSIFLFDLKFSIIPDKIIFPSIFAVLIFYLIFFLKDANFSAEILFNFFLAAILASLFFFTIYFFSKGKAMGFGDVKLGFLLGLIFGLPKIILVLWLAFIIGGPFAIFLIFLKKKTLKSEIALGPFLIIASFIIIFLGNKILSFFYF